MMNERFHIAEPLEYLQRFYLMNGSEARINCPDNGSAELEARNWSITLYKSTCGGVEMTYLWVHPRIRGTGQGTAILSGLCRWADSNQQLLWGWAMPFETAGHGFPKIGVYDLAAWYAREFGFMPTRQRTEGYDGMGKRICVRIKREPA